MKAELAAKEFLLIAGGTADNGGTVETYVNPILGTCKIIGIDGNGCAGVLISGGMFYIPREREA